MSCIVLQPCKVMDGCFALTSGARLELDFDKFRQEFIPPKDNLGKYKMTLLKPGAYVGTSNTKSGKRLFVLISPDRTGNISWVTDKDPGFQKRIERVYRVESMTRDSNITEAG